MSEKDKAILIDLWRWKLLTTAALVELHFSQFDPTYAYRKMNRLRTRGVVKIVAIPFDKTGRSFAWTLTVKGFNSVLPELGTLREIGYESEILNHDYYLMAAHLGDWAGRIPENCEVFTEQELRRRHLDQYPDWIPNSKSHRPDGYWRTCLDGQLGTIALEVECSQKRPTKYREIATFYSKRTELFRVIWIVDSLGLGKMIWRAIEAIGGPGKNLHMFFLKEDFIRLGWEARCILGRDAGNTLCAYLISERSTSCSHVNSTLILNASKSPQRSKTYVDLRNHLISYRVLSTPTSTHTVSVPNTTPNKGETTNE